MPLLCLKLDNFVYAPIEVGINEGTIGKAFNEYSRPVQLAKPEDVKSDYYFSIQTPDMKGQLLKLAHLKQLVYPFMR